MRTDLAIQYVLAVRDDVLVSSFRRIERRTGELTPYVCTCSEPMRAIKCGVFTSGRVAQLAEEYRIDSDAIKFLQGSRKQ